MPINKKKQELREKLYVEIENLSKKYKNDSDKKIIDVLLSSKEYRDAETIFTFVGVDNEINTTPFIKQALQDKKIICTPRCKKNKEMDALRIESLFDLENSIWGLKEPVATCPIIHPDNLDLIIIPCLTCDSYGYRIGHGAGYYDRYLATTSATDIILCREQLKVEELPIESFDISADYYITEKGLFNANS